MDLEKMWRSLPNKHSFSISERKPFPKQFEPLMPQSDNPISSQPKTGTYVLKHEPFFVCEVAIC